MNMTMSPVYFSGTKRLAKFMDVTADDLLDAEAQGLLKSSQGREGLLGKLRLVMWE